MTTLLALTSGNRWKKIVIVIGHAIVLDDAFTTVELKPKRWHQDDYGYPRHSPSYQTGVRLHSLVYEHYHGAIPKGLVIDHIDRNLLNATPENLRAVPQCVNAANRGCFGSREEAECVAQWAFFEQYPELRCG